MHSPVLAGGGGSGWGHCVTLIADAPHPALPQRGEGTLYELTHTWYGFVIEL